MKKVLMIMVMAVVTMATTNAFCEGSGQSPGKKFEVTTIKSDLIDPGLPATVNDLAFSPAMSDILDAKNKQIELNDPPA